MQNLLAEMLFLQFILQLYLQLYNILGVLLLYTLFFNYFFYLSLSSPLHATFPFIFFFFPS
jgi:hypothetical protein